jgi:hypothetical protein
MVTVFGNEVEVPPTLPLLGIILCRPVTLSPCRPVVLSPAWNVDETAKVLYKSRSRSQVFSSSL